MLIIRKTPELTLHSLALRAVVTNRKYSKNYASSSDDEKDTKKQKETKAEKSASSKPEEESAAKRLNRLLASMNTDDSTLVKQTASMARPGDSNKKRKEEAKERAATKDVFTAAKRIASLVGEENQQQTESELLAKLLGRNQNENNELKGEDSSKAEEADLSLSELIVGMKIDRRQQPPEQTRSDYVRRMLGARTQRQTTSSRPMGAQHRERQREAEGYTGSVNLFGSDKLGIFKQPAELQESPDTLSTWAHLQNRELKLQTVHPPMNYFEKIALWTEQGKVWRYPIDNEQDWREETDVDFSEHIFLEQHLEPWCPAQGPIRHFMELVCVGLSKNPYISAKEKREHILWYRDYFEAKKDILKDLMFKEKVETAGAATKQVEA